jgi:hypothetical protein
MTDAKARGIVIRLGKAKKGESFTMNPMSGTKGNFYRTNREEDILSVCRELIQEKYRAVKIS